MFLWRLIHSQLCFCGDIFSLRDAPELILSYTLVEIYSVLGMLLLRLILISYRPTVFHEQRKDLYRPLVHKKKILEDFLKYVLKTNLTGTFSGDLCSKGFFQQSSSTGPFPEQFRFFCEFLQKSQETSPLRKINAEQEKLLR